jgi:hypothetical protein
VSAVVPLVETVPAVCKNCGKIFPVLPQVVKLRKYCSGRCQHVGSGWAAKKNGYERERRRARKGI